MPLTRNRHLAASVPMECCTRRRITSVVDLLRLRWRCHAFRFPCQAMLLPCCCHAIAMPPCHCHAVAMPLLPCHWHTVAMPLPCHCHGVAMRVPCACLQRRIALALGCAQATHGASKYAAMALLTQEIASSAPQPTTVFVAGQPWYDIIRQLHPSKPN